MSHQIEIIGLGSGDLDQLSLGHYNKLMNTKKKIFLRTKDHPIVTELSKKEVQYDSFDKFYEKYDEFLDVYHHIVQFLLHQAKDEDIIYAVPGHPMVAEFTVQLLLEQDDVTIKLLGGQSYLDALFTSLKIDPIDGFEFIDALSFQRSDLNYEHHIVFCQVYDQFVASNVKLELLEDLPADYQVTVIKAAGSAKEKILNIPLKDLDRSIELDNLTSVYIPPAPESMLHHTFSKLRNLIATLRDPSIDEWASKQTHESLRSYMIEESQELIKAIDQKDDESIIEELGDILLQVMLHSQIGEDAGYFTIDDVIRGLTSKMINRHLPKHYD